MFFQKYVLNVVSPKIINIYITTFERMKTMSTRFLSTAAAEEIVKDIRDGKYTDSASALGLLKQIVNDLPGTSVAREAQRLIDERY